MKHIRAVLNQGGVAMELHGHSKQPITITLIRPAELDAYRAELAKSNPDFRHAVLGQLAVMYANRIFQDKDIKVSQSPWTYNASTDTYERG
jgi:hypothetical protein